MPASAINAAVAAARAVFSFRARVAACCACLLIMAFIVPRLAVAALCLAALLSLLYIFGSLADWCVCFGTVLLCYSVGAAGIWVERFL